MVRKLFMISVLALGIGRQAEAQMAFLPGDQEARLSGWCQSVETGRAVNGALGDFRVRRGGSVHATGTRQTIVVDEGGKAEVTGLASTVFVRKGGEATVSGERVSVYAEPGAKVAVSGANRLATVEHITITLNRNALACQ
jgi:hypothetical protein